MTTFEETLIEFTASIDLEHLSDTIYDSSRAMVGIINKTNKADIDKISMFVEYLNGIGKGISIGSKNNIKVNDIIIISFIDSIILKYKNKQISSDKTWSDILDLLD